MGTPSPLACKGMPLKRICAEQKRGKSYNSRAIELSAIRESSSSPVLKLLAEKEIMSRR